MYLFEEKIWFWLLLIIPAVMVLYGLLVFWQKRAQKKFANPLLLRQLSPDKSIFKGVLKVLVFCLAIFFLVVALVNPKMGTKLETVKREGVDVVFARNPSNSLLRL